MANYSKVSICNMALSLLGADSIRDFNEVNKRARLADVQYEPAKSYLLAKFDWPFARAFSNLSKLDLSSEDVPEGTNGFQLPANCRTPRDIHPLGSRDQWDVVGDRVYTPCESVGLYYTADDTPPGRFSDTFANLLALLLAVKLAPPITQDVKLTAELYRQFVAERRECWESDANIGNMYREYNEDPNNDTFVYPPGTGWPEEINANSSS